MGKKLYETIILKEDSYQDYEYEIKKKSFSSNQEEINILEKGIKGEKQVLYHLNKSNIGMYVLRDINLKYKDMTAQIDFVVVTAYNCYFIECKNYSADIIHVDENRNFEMSTRYGNRYNKKGMNSPISQVEDQLTVFQKICLDDEEKVKEVLKGNRFKEYFKTLVVFTNQNNRLNLTKAPNDIKYRILKADNLIRQMEYDKNHYKGKLLTEEEMKQIADYILTKNYVERIEEAKIKVNDLNQKKEKKNNIINQKSKENNKNIMKIVIGIAIMILCLILSNYSLPNNNIIQNNKKMTENQIKAIKIMNAAYKDSITNGFSIIHTNVCKEISKMFNNKLDCTRIPLKINVLEENKKYTVFHSMQCYSLELNDKNEIINNTVKYETNMDNCSGTAVGFLEWDNDNEYYQKIGGNTKIKEMAIYAYTKNAFVHDYYDDKRISERGGNPNLWSSYMMDVDMFFAGLTDKGYSIKSDTTKKEFEEMVKNFYYIMK